MLWIAIKREIHLCVVKSKAKQNKTMCYKNTKAHFHFIFLFFLYLAQNAMSLFSHNWLQKKNSHHVWKVPREKHQPTTTTTIHSVRKGTTEYNLIYNFFVYIHTMPRERNCFAYLTVSRWISNSKSEIQSVPFKVVWHVCSVPQPISRHST